MFVSYYNGCPLTSIITMAVLSLLKTLHPRSFSTNLVNFKSMQLISVIYRLYQSYRSLSKISVSNIG
ncbi:hypothetical protein Hanom_Chr13g01244541 [Helianthus anomalus]